MKDMKKQDIPNLTKQEYLRNLDLADLEADPDTGTNLYEFSLNKKDA